MIAGDFGSQMKHLLFISVMFNIMMLIFILKAFISVFSLGVFCRWFLTGEANHVLVTYL